MVSIRKFYFRHAGPDPAFRRALKHWIPVFTEMTVPRSRWGILGRMPAGAGTVGHKRKD
jgi:hypothetical protein